ncbi:MAG: nitroreductase [Pseudomonadota bacterium]|nr:nitroreductase [Pseudomonadota bacterium]
MPYSALDFLRARHSTPARQLGEPGPDAAQLRELLEASIRVPDHGKLVPWRLIVLQGNDRARYGERLAQLHARVDPTVAESKLVKDRERFDSAPLVIAVIARIEDDHPKIPAQEQLLSAGCVAYNLLLGAQVLDFGAQWLTGWSCYDREAAKLLGLTGHERAIAYIHIGTPRETPPERVRPALDEIVGTWKA